MRLHTHGNIQVSYPEAFCYAFNPIPVEVTGLAEFQKIALTAGGTTIEATAFGGTVRFDLSRIAQSMFDTKTLSVIDYSREIVQSRTTVPLTVSIPDLELTFDTLCIWGALQTDLGTVIGGDFNDDFSNDFANTLLKPLVESIWYYGLPYTVSVPMLAGDVLRVSVDGGVTLDVYTADRDEMILASPELILSGRSLTARASVSIFLCVGDMVKREYRIGVRYEFPDPIYVRWIDKKGHYCYYAFEKAAYNYETVNYGTFLPTYTRLLDYVDGFNGGDGRQQGKTAKHIVGVVAPLVPIDVWSYLLGICSSPIVDVYTENDYLGSPRFLKVDVTPGKIVRDSMVLADFAATITLPELNNQTL